MHARKLPRLNSEPYREEYENYNKNKFRTFNHQRNSPEKESDSSMFNKSYRDRDQRDYNKYRKSSSREDRDRSPRERKWDCKEKEVERLTSCGDWSEHKSSSGKRYYYNCKTEVSQWEKPREWVEQERAARQAGSAASPTDSTPRLAASRSNSIKDKRCDWPERVVVESTENNISRSAPPAAATAAKLHCDTTLRGSQDKHASSPYAHSRQRDRAGDDGGGGGGGDATPTSEGESAGPPSYTAAAAAAQHHLHPSGAVSLSAAIQRITAQHTASLAVRIAGWNSPLSSSSQSPPTPTQNEQTLQQAVVSPLQQLQTATVTLTPSLARLYREDLISHVQGWPAEQVERGSHRLGDEAHQIASHGITRVSAELKMARSLVRLAEIQATLQEQRILFLRQQMLDLEQRHTTTSTTTTSSSTVTSHHSSSSHASIPSDSLSPLDSNSHHYHHLHHHHQSEAGDQR